jgi:hypothetical protein
LDQIIIGDKILCYQYDLKAKCQSMEWDQRIPPGQRNHRCRSPWSKQCWYTFLTLGVSSTFNLYTKGPVIRHSTWKRWKGLLMSWGTSEESCEDCPLTLHHDNVPAVSIFKCQFSAGKCIFTMDHLPYSPDVSQADFWLFPKLKSVLKAKCFLNTEGIKSCVKKFWQTLLSRILKTKLRGFSLQANYTDRATAACRRSQCQLLWIEDVTWSAQWIPIAVSLDFLDPEPLLFH